MRPAQSDAPYLGWLGIIRMGLVQTALGSIIVLTTSTINRVMVVELALAAALPGALVAWHYALQFLRPRWGYGSDTGGRRTPWIVFGIGTLGLGGTGAALSVALMATSFWPGASSPRRIASRRRRWTQSDRVAGAVLCMPAG